MLTLNNLSCARGDRVLFSGATLTLAPGDGLYVTGPNGTGKTTLLRVISGLAQPEDGEVLWGGVPVRSLREEFSRNLLFLGHAAALKDELSAVENLCVAAAISGHVIAPDDAVAALRRIGLRGREHLPVRVLSAGQRRRVNLARLMLPNPAPLWVLDEPFTALDAKAVSQLASILADHLRAGGLVVFTTHQDVELPGISVRQLSIENGRAAAC